MIAWMPRVFYVRFLFCLLLAGCVFDQDSDIAPAAGFYFVEVRADSPWFSRRTLPEPYGRVLLCTPEAEQFRCEEVNLPVHPSPPTGTSSEVRVPNEFELLVPTICALDKLGEIARIARITEQVIEDEEFPPAIAAAPHSGNNQTELEYRLGWARTVLKSMGYVDNPQRGIWELTSQAKEGLAAGIIPCGSRQRERYNDILDERKN